MSKSRSATSRRWLEAAPILAALLYLPSLGYPFLYDDVPIIELNPVISSWSGLREVFSSDYWSMSVSGSGNYRPLTMASYVVNGAALGVASWHFRTVNIVLLGLVGWMISRLGRALGMSAAIGAFSGTAYVVHPLRVETAVKIVGRAELLIGRRGPNAGSFDQG
ncbi:MAG: hypothetical protein N2111_11480 [Candidatus Sumerlaeaceae bacterium]|nr:hypothetical protein [Candidatus Sumerlaeaceae bacterium]